MKITLCDIRLVMSITFDPRSFIYLFTLIYLFISFKDEYVENNRGEYGAKKAILHVLSNRMNEAGFYREEPWKLIPSSLALVF